MELPFSSVPWLCLITCSWRFCASDTYLSLKYTRKFFFFTLQQQPFRLPAVNRNETLKKKPDRAAKCQGTGEISSLYRVRTLFWTKTSRAFQRLSRTHFAIFKDSIQCKKEIWVYVFFSSTTTWAILSWRSFILGTWESGLDKVSTEIQGLSSTDCNFQGLSRPWTFNFDFQRLSRCVRTLVITGVRISVSCSMH